MRSGPASKGIPVRAGVAGAAAGNCALTASTIWRRGEAGIDGADGAATVSADPDEAGIASAVGVVPKDRSEAMAGSRRPFSAA